MNSQSKESKIKDLRLRVSRIEQALERLGTATGVDLSDILDPVDLDDFSLKGLL